jgi:hypothetical protein
MRPDSVAKEPDPYDFVYRGLPENHLVLKKVPNCEFCRAKRFPGEGPAFCCRKGCINIFIPEVPDELRHLFTSQTDSNAKYFRKHIRYFNSHFSFTSFGVSVDRQLATAKGTGVYTFKAQGQICLVVKDHGICSCIFMTQTILYLTGLRGLPILMLS